jgi:glucose/arabinose dehydrogenase
MPRSLLSCLLLAAFLPLGCNTGIQLDKINLPPGFSISVYARDLENARSLAISPGGTVFVGSRGAGNVYAVVDADRDGTTAEKTYIIASGLDTPNGVAFRDGALYVAEARRIIRFDNIEANLESPPVPVVIYDQLPEMGHHEWKYLTFGPDGKLYSQIGAPCNNCNEEERDERFATLFRIDPDGSNFEIVARGVRNSLGVDWHPLTQQLWFTENGRDWMGDNRPPDELNKVTELGEHFGFPYCHGGDTPDPEFAAGRACAEFVPPVQKLGTHVAALGMRFYSGTQFPAEYRNQILIAEHGSWNRTFPTGYRIMLVKLDDAGSALSYTPFATGWIQHRPAWGRPVDLLVTPDGSLLVSDDEANAIYRITYTP